MTRDQAVNEMERLASLASDWRPPDPAISVMIQRHDPKRPRVVYEIRRGPDVLAVCLLAPSPRANRERVHSLLDAMAAQLGKPEMQLDAIREAMLAITGQQSHVLDTAGMGVG